jgi:hypothetical protein
MDGRAADTDMGEDPGVCSVLNTELRRELLVGSLLLLVSRGLGFLSEHLLSFLVSLEQIWSCKGFAAVGMLTDKGILLSVVHLVAPSPGQYQTQCGVGEVGANLRCSARVYDCSKLARGPYVKPR